MRLTPSWPRRIRRGRVLVREGVRLPREASRPLSTFPDFLFGVDPERFRRFAKVGLFGRSGPLGQIPGESSAMARPCHIPADKQTEQGLGADAGSAESSSEDVRTASGNEWSNGNVPVELPAARSQRAIQLLGCDLFRPSLWGRAGRKPQPRRVPASMRT